MKITLKLFASLQDYLPGDAATGNAIELDLATGTTIGQLIERFRLPQASCKLVLVDGRFVPPDERATRTLENGETLAIWPPIAGG